MAKKNKNTDKNTNKNGKAIKQRKTRCTICNHPERDAIEMQCIVGAALPWSELTEKVNHTFNTRFHVKTIQNHMKNHPLKETAIDAGIIMKGIVNEDGETPRITAQSMLQTMFIQGARDVARGYLKPKNVTEMIQLIEAMQRLQENEQEKDLLADGDKQGFYTALAVISEAVKSVVSAEQLAKIISRSQTMGMKIDITSIPIEETLRINDVDFDIIEEDYKRLGRGRTREELVRDGVIEEDTVNNILDN